MRFRTASFIVSLVLVSVFSAPVIADSPDGDSLVGRLATDISVFPTEDPNVWMAEATVTDIESGEILTQPQVRFKPGEAAKLRSGGMLSPDRKDEFEVVLEIFVGESGENAKYTSTVSIGGEVVSQLSAKFKLK